MAWDSEQATEDSLWLRPDAVQCDRSTSQAGTRLSGLPPRAEEYMLPKESMPDQQIRNTEVSSPPGANVLPRGGEGSGLGHGQRHSPSFVWHSKHFTATSSNIGR